MDPNEIYVVFDAHVCKHKGIATGAVLKSKYPDIKELSDGVFRLNQTMVTHLVAIRADGVPLE